jgi:hypothetical protein
MFDHEVNPQTGTYLIKRIGEVVEISRATGSMVFTCFCRFLALSVLFSRSFDGMLSRMPR